MTSKQDRQRPPPIALDRATLHLGDNREVLKLLPDSSVDTIVTDPPYEIGFMGKSWDSSGIAYDIRMWKECLRVLKPGGHIIVFAAARTYHRVACAIEDAGFDIRDQMMWIFGSGFPKSHNLDGEHEGWGTALKPAHEPIVLARKPFAESVAQNMQRYGVGALNIAACRVESPEGVARIDYSETDAARGYNGGLKGGTRTAPQTAGRWPANVMHDGSDEVLQAFPHAPGAQADVTGNEPTANGFSGTVKYTGMLKRQAAAPIIGDSGNAGRFFYCAKASTLDRDEGVTAPPKPVVQFQTANGTSGKASSLSAGRKTMRRNDHPTVKPTDLMRYLCRLVTPPSGIVLDPFMGSGSTGKAAMLEGFQFIGIDLDAHYRDIARDRIIHAHRLKREIDEKAAFEKAQIPLL